MAADLSGMFTQLNKAIGQNPMAQGGMGKGLLDTAGASLGNLLGGATGQDPMSFMSEGARGVQGAKQLSSVDLSTPEGLMQAAEIYQKMGQTAEAMEMLQSAQLLADRLEAQQKAQNAKDHAILEAGQITIQENSAKTRLHSQLVHAMALARRDADTDALPLLKSGNLDPVAYIDKKMGDKKLFELSKGEGLYDKKGNRIVLNPDLSSTDKKGLVSVHDKKQWDTLSTDAYENDAWSKKAEALAEQVEASPTWTAGVEATVEDALLGMMGKRDDPQYLRTRVNSIRNHDAIGMLPPGPASDKDIKIVMKGVPPENAGREEVIEFLRATSRVSAKLAEYSKMRAEYTIRQDRESFQKDWDIKVAREARQEWIQATPEAAIEALQEDSSLRDAFLDKYKWLPAGV